MSISLSIREVDNKIIKLIEYIVVSVYFKSKYNDKSTIVKVNIKIYLINDLKTRLLIDVNIINSKNITLNFLKNYLIIESCQDFEIIIKFKIRLNLNTRRIIRVKKTFILILEQLVNIFVIYHKTLLNDRDFLFESQCSIDIRQNDDIYTYVVDASFYMIQIRNINNYSIMLLKKVRLNIVIKYN